MNDENKYIVRGDIVAVLLRKSNKFKYGYVLRKVMMSENGYGPYMIRVIWYPYGPEQLLSSIDVELIDRLHVPGGIVRKAVYDKPQQVGRVESIDTLTAVKIVGTNKIIENINTKQLTLADPFPVNSTVMYRKLWTGRVKKVNYIYTFALKDGTTFMLENPDPRKFIELYKKRLFSFDGDLFFLGQKLKIRLNAFSKTEFINPSYFMNILLKFMKKSKTKWVEVYVQDIFLSSVEVLWYALPVHSIDNTISTIPMWPSAIVAGDDLKRLKYIGLSNICSLQDGKKYWYTIKDTDELLTMKEWRTKVAQNMSNKRGSATPILKIKRKTIKKHKYSVKSMLSQEYSLLRLRGKTPSLTIKSLRCKFKRQLKQKFSTKPKSKVLVEIYLTRSLIDVIWQDGTKGTRVPSIDLLYVSYKFYLDNITPSIRFPGDYVIVKNRKDYSYGVIESINQTEYTTRVNLFKRMEHSLPKLIETNEFSLYDISDDPINNFAFGNVVIFTHSKGDKTIFKTGYVLNSTSDGKVLIMLASGRRLQCYPSDLNYICPCDYFFFASFLNKIFDDGVAEYLENPLELCDDLEFLIYPSAMIFDKTMFETSKLVIKSQDQLLKEIQQGKNLTTEDKEKMLMYYNRIRGISQLSLFDGMISFGQFYDADSPVASTFEELVELYKAQCDQEVEEKKKEKVLKEIMSYVEINQSAPETVLIFNTISDKVEIDNDNDLSIEDIIVQFPKSKTVECNKKCMVLDSESDCKIDNIFESKEGEGNTAKNEKIAQEKFDGEKYKEIEAISAPSKMFNKSESDSKFEKLPMVPENSKDQSDVNEIIQNIVMIDSLPEYEIDNIVKPKEAGVFDFVETFEDDTHKFQIKFDISPLMLKVISKEIKILQKSLPSGIWVKTFENRMDLFSIMIKGPDETPYAGGLFIFDIQLPPTYPNEPPKCMYRNFSGTQINPNLYTSGFVCLSLLGTWKGQSVETWSSKHSNLLQLCISLQAFIFVSEPYFNEPGLIDIKYTEHGQGNSRFYNEMTVLNVIDSMINMLNKKSQYSSVKYFEQEITEHFRLYGLKYIDQIEDLVKKHDLKNLTNEDKTFDPGFPLLPLTNGFCKSVKPYLKNYKRLLMSVKKDKNNQ